MTKLFVKLFAMFFISSGWAADVPVPAPAPAPLKTIKGEVLEVTDIGTYTYLRLKTKDGEIWAAVAGTGVGKGAQVTIENAAVMHNFESRALQKKFDKIVFGNLSAKDASAAGTRGDMDAQHAGIAKAPDAADLKIAKANGADARTVAEIVSKKAELKDKRVQVRGKIVKYTPGVLGRNWIHLRDGSGSAAANTNDVLVTTKDEARIGDVVIVKGIVRTDMDLGSGYAYKVLVEASALQR